MTFNLILQNETGAKTPTKESIQAWLEKACEIIPDKIPKQQRQLTLRVVDTDESAELNSRYRNKPYATNVLSFPDTPFPGIPSDSLGDLALCAQKVVEEAQAQQKAVEAHWAHLTIHGFLHLLGYDHEQEQEAALMEALEVKILTQLGFPHPYE